MGRALERTSGAARLSRERGEDVAVVRSARQGGPVTQLASLPPSGYGRKLAIDAESVYWTDPLARTVMKVPLAGGPVTMLACVQDSPEGIAVDATSVYFSTFSDSQLSRIMSVAK